MSSNATSLSNLRRLGLKHGISQQKNNSGNLNRYKSNSQDLLNENNIKSRLDEELNWLEGSRPNSRSIENLLGSATGPPGVRIPVNGNVEEKKRKLLSQGLFSPDLDQSERKNRFEIFLGTPRSGTSREKKQYDNNRKKNKNGDYCARPRKQIFALPPNENKKITQIKKVNFL